MSSHTSGPKVNQNRSALVRLQLSEIVLDEAGANDNLAILILIELGFGENPGDGEFEGGAGFGGELVHGLKSFVWVKNLADFLTLP